MVKMTLLNGQYAGVTRDVAGVSPRGLLNSLLDSGTLWEIDYSQATESEKIHWGKEDLACRCLRAMRAGLPVWFLGETYSDPGELEDVIVYSGKMVTVASDNERGVVIEPVGDEF